MRWGALLAVVTLASVARAEEHVVAPPHPREVAVAYPTDARGEAVVIFELVIDDGGRVAQWRVLAGAEPFLTAAKTAVSTFTFEPATRDGRPVAARIRLEVPFHPRREPVAHVEVVRVEHLPPKRPPPPIAGVEDVRVRGVRKELGGTTMTREEVRDIPGAFGDAFRAIDMMPGVVPIVSGLPFFFVRGAPPGNTGYFVDDVRVPLLYHVAVGPSVIHPSLIDRVDFYPGGYPAQYGRFTGGIVAGETQGPSGHLRGEAELRLYDVGVLGETPFASGKGDALVAGRYGYPALLVQLIAPTTSLAYWDYQGRVSYRVTPRDTLTAFVFGSFDELDERNATAYDANGNPTQYGPFSPLLRTEFHRADLRWDHAVPGGNIRTALTFGLDNSVAGGAFGSDPSSADAVQAESIQLRTELDRTLSSTLRMRTGADVLLYHYDYSPFGTITLPSRNDVMFGGYADIVWKVHPCIEIVPGLRVDMYTSRSEGTLPPDNDLAVLANEKPVAVPAVDPRLAARVTVNRRLTWVGTFGITHQPPSFFIPVPGAELGNLANGLQTAVQASQGFEAKLPLAFELKGTFYIQSYFDMTNALQSCTGLATDSSGIGCLDQRMNGRSVGLEVMLRRSFSKHVTGWISYTFSRSTVELKNPTPGLLGTEPVNVPSNFDRPNVLNAVFAADLGKGWHTGARFTYYTGLPYTRTVAGLPVPPYNGYRLPDFWRIDIRLEKRWRLGAHSQIAAVLEGLNITFNKEALGIDCKFDGKCAPQYIGPVSVPSLGVEAKY